MFPYQRRSKVPPIICYPPPLIEPKLRFKDPHIVSIFLCIYMMDQLTGSVRVKSLKYRTEDFFPKKCLLVKNGKNKLLISRHMTHLFAH